MSSLHRVALDIETVSPDLAPEENPNFRDPDDFELLAIGLALQEQPHSPIKRQVLLRNGWGPEAEVDLIDRMLEQCSPVEPGTPVITYNGDNFDFIHLRGRAERAAQNLGDRYDVSGQMNHFLDLVDSDDIINDVRNTYGQISLEEVCDRLGILVPETRWPYYDHGLDIESIRPSYQRGQSVIESADIPQLGETYLNWFDQGLDGTSEFRELERLIMDYTDADIEPLIKLADARPFNE